MARITGTSSTTLGLVILVCVACGAAAPLQALPIASSPFALTDITWFKSPQGSSLLMSPTLDNGRQYVTISHTPIGGPNVLKAYILLNQHLVGQAFSFVNLRVQARSPSADIQFGAVIVQGGCVYEAAPETLLRDQTDLSIANLTADSFHSESCVDNSTQPNFAVSGGDSVQFGFWVGRDQASSAGLDYSIFSAIVEATRPYSTAVASCSSRILQQNVNIISRWIPNFTKITHRFEGNCTYKGVTVSDFRRIVLEKDSDKSLFEEGLNEGNMEAVAGTYPMDLDVLPDGAKPFVYGNDAIIYSLDEFDANFTSSTGKPSIYGFIDRLQSITIRGVNFYSILQDLACQNGIYYPMAIVGGAIRDYMLGQPVNDIDVAIAQPYADLVFRLREIFASRGAAIDETVLVAYGLRKQYGLIKVIQNKLLDPDALDIGPMKANDYYKEGQGGTTQIKNSEGNAFDGIPSDVAENHYTYGYTYELDAATRDYTVNAIYLELFGLNPKVIDAYGTGIEDNLKNTVRPPNSTRSVVASPEDLGGLFRYFKLYDKGYRPEEGIGRVNSTELPKAVCYNLNTGWLGTTNTRTANQIIYKLRKKLYKDDVTDYARTTLQLRANVEKQGEQECVDMWNNLVDLCKGSMVRDELKTLNGDNPDDLRVVAVVNEMIKQEKLDPAPAKRHTKRYVASTLQTNVDQRLVREIKCSVPKLTRLVARVDPNYEFGRTFGEYDDDAESSPVVSYPTGTDFKILDQTKTLPLYVHQLYIYGTYSPSDSPLEGAYAKIAELDKFSLYSPIYDSGLSLPDLTLEITKLYNDEAKLTTFAGFVSTLLSSPPEKDFTDISFRAEPTYIRAHRLVLLSRIPSVSWQAFNLATNNMLDVPATIWLPSNKLPSTTGFKLFLEYIYTGVEPQTIDDAFDKETYQYLRSLSKVDEVPVCSGSALTSWSMGLVSLMLVLCLIF